ncbi:MAG: DMT family transporter [Acidimicrobiales bacterium]|nr:DMT family transporter [Acidimicrobiales bacterium]MDP6297905.1 DMT family transporter [Acidimicrobiales bacterium]HJM28531.1 DMT family transporter [Acidimicrobiales bacterium]
MANSVTLSQETEHIIDTQSSDIPHNNELRIGIISCSFGYILIAIASVIVSDSEVHGLTMAFWRSWIGVPVLGLYVLLKQKQKFNWHNFLLCAPAGICFGSAIGLFFWSTQITSLINASLISSLQPLIIIFLSYYFFSEKITSGDIGLSLLSIGGAIIIVLAGTSDGSGKISGDFIAFIGIALGAGYFAFAKKTLRKLGVAEFMTGYFIWSGITLTPMMLLAGAGIMPQTERDIVQILAVASVPGVGHVLLNFSQGRTPLSLIGILQLLVPVTATVSAVLFLEATISGIKGLGMIIVFIGLGSSSYIRSKRNEKEPTKAET